MLNKTVNIKRISLKRTKSTSIHKIKIEEIIVGLIKIFRIVLGRSKNQHWVKSWIVIKKVWPINLGIWNLHALLITISTLNSYPNLNKLGIPKMFLCHKIYKMILINKVTNRIFLLIIILDQWTQTKHKKQ